MAYQATLINRLCQFGTTEYDVLISDDAGIMPDMRLSAQIKKEIKDITSQDLIDLKNTIRQNALAIHNSRIAEIAARVAHLVKLNNALTAVINAQNATGNTTLKATYQVVIDLINKETPLWQ